jgi:hypothetical protein
MRNSSGSKECIYIAFDPDVATKLRAEHEKTEVAMARIVNRAMRAMYKLPPLARKRPAKQTA